MKSLSIVSILSGIWMVVEGWCKAVETYCTLHHEAIVQHFWMGLAFYGLACLILAAAWPAVCKLIFGGEE